MEAPPRPACHARATEDEGIDPTQPFGSRILSGVRARRPETPGEKQQVRISPEPLPSQSEKARDTQVS